MRSAPACRGGRGHGEPAAGSPACWRAALVRPPDGWRAAGRWSSPQGCGRPPAGRSCRPGHGGSPRRTKGVTIHTEGLYWPMRSSESLSDGEGYSTRDPVAQFLRLTFEMKTPGSRTPNGWLAWSLPPTMLSPRGPPAFTSITSCQHRKYRF